MEDAGLSYPAPEQLAGHEDNVGQHVLIPLFQAAGYSEVFDIFHKPTLTHAIVGQLRAPDFGVYRYQEQPKPLFGMVADVKAAGETLTPSMEEKLAGYCGLAGASYGVLTNGADLVVLRPKRGVVDWDYLDHIPTRDELTRRLDERPTEYPEEHIVYAGRITGEITENAISDLAKRCHEMIRSRKGKSVTDRLYEFSKLLITRIMDERGFAEGRQNSLLLTAASLAELQRRRVNLKKYINERFEAIRHDIGIFPPREGIDLPVDLIRRVLEYLDQFPLWSREIDVLGQVYEKFLVKTMTGQELGQYFTPRPVVEAIVEMIGPARGQRILDPACGSGGCLISALSHLKVKYDAWTAGAIRPLAQGIRGVDIDENVTKLCQINLFLHGDSHDNVYRADSLNPEGLPDFVAEALADPRRHGFDCIITNPPFGAREGNRFDARYVEAVSRAWHDQDIDLYECGVQNARYRDLQPQSAFMELCINLLKKPRAPGAGGRLGVVVDNGMLSNTGNEEPEVRALIRRECIIEAVVGMPKGTFKPYGSNVIGDFLILRRKHPREQQGPVFRAEVLNIGLVPGLTGYKEASDIDLTRMLAAWREWNGGQGVANEGA